jgi:hypothetical protein
MYDLGDFQTARHHKKALSAGLPERMNGLGKKKVPRVKLRDCNTVEVFIQFPVII